MSVGSAHRHLSTNSRREKQSYNKQTKLHSALDLVTLPSRPFPSTDAPGCHFGSNVV